MIRILSFIFVVGIVTPAAAQQPQLPSTFRCDFPGSSVRYMKPESIEAQASDSLSDVVFTQIDLAKTTALMVGNAASTPIAAMRRGEALHLVEWTALGSLNTTTIFTNTAHRKQDGVHYRAVMSRHTAGFGSDALVTQLYGSCRALR